MAKASTKEKMGGGSAVDKLERRAEERRAAQEAAARKESAANSAEGEIYVPLAKLRFDPNQPRRRYHAMDGKIQEKDQTYIEELAANIARRAEAEGTDGLIQAITVSEFGDGTFVVRAGECRSRAHIHLQREVIRAKINNNLNQRRERLLFQLSENILSDDLEDWEIAQTVKELMAGNDDEEPMKQVEIAAELGKSEGYLTRFVVFGDDELRKRWVETGIVDTAEKLYRLKLLPEHMKLDILRRVELDSEHPDYLSTPLKRSVIDDYSTTVQMEKKRQKAATAATPAKAAPASGKSDSAKGGSGVTPAAAWPFPTGSRPDGAGTAAAPQAGGDGVTNALGRNEEGYTLDDAAREALLSGTAAANARADARDQQRSKAPVTCKVPLASLEQLLPLLRTRPELLESVRRVICHLQLPGELAQQVASALVGVQVDEQALPATIQDALTGLATPE